MQEAAPAGTPHQQPQSNVSASAERLEYAAKATLHTDPISKIAQGEECAIN